MKPKPIITVKEARKLLGTQAKTMTDLEIERFVSDSEQLIRLLLKDYMVPKSAVV